MVYRLDAVQHLDTGLDEAWRFFSDAGNLREITPGELDFRITSGGAPAVYPGLIITYRVKPLFGIEVGWVTRISRVQEPAGGSASFADDQLVGPYALWHHEHRFRETGRGVEAVDVVHYALPLELITRFVHGLAVEPQLRRIFNHRAEVLARRFGNVEGTAPSLDVTAL